MMTQLRYMVNESQFVNYEIHLKTPDQSVAYYMKHAYNWLGWGIHGNRTSYANDYVNRFTTIVPHPEVYPMG